MMPPNTPTNTQEATSSSHEDDVLELLYDGLITGNEPQKSVSDQIKRAVARKLDKSDNNKSTQKVTLNRGFADLQILEELHARQTGQMLPLNVATSSQAAWNAKKTSTSQNHQADITNVADHSATTSNRIGDILVRMGKITSEQVEYICEHQARSNMTFGRAAVTMNLVSEADIKKAIEIQFGYVGSSENQKGVTTQQLVMFEKPFSKEAEQIRILRTRLMTQEHQAALKLLSVTSINEHAPYVTANLAIAFAQMDRKVLLIDGNLRSPKMHKLFGLGDVPGVYDVMSGRVRLRDALSESVVRNLTILPAGPAAHNPQEILSSDGFRKLVMKSMDQYDSILICSPGGKETADGQYIWALTKSVLMIAQRDKVKLKEVKALSNIIRDCGAHIVGTVLSV